MCKLVNKTTDKVVVQGDKIFDVAGNPWMYFICSPASGNNGKPEVIAHRMVGDRPAKRGTAFALSFFPNYRVSVAK